MPSKLQEKLFLDLAVEVICRPRPRSPTRPMVAIWVIVGVGVEVGKKGVGVIVGVRTEEEGNKREMMPTKIAFKDTRNYNSFYEKNLIGVNFGFHSVGL